MSMRPYNNKTIKQDDQPGYASAVVGDEQQKEFHPRVKFQKWQNEANFSIGLDESPDGAQVQKRGDTVTFKKNGKTARFYPISGKLIPVTSIRRVLKGDEIEAVASGAEYEMFNQIGKQGEMMIAHYVVTEPSVSVFDLMPASAHLEVFEKDGKVMAKDFNYPDKSEYHPSDVPIPSYDAVALVRYYTPYNLYINPYYMDEGLHNLDFQWKGSDFTTCIEDLMQSIEDVFIKHGVEVTRQPDKNGQLRKKIYFKDKEKDRWVKFFSAQEEDQGLYAYLNIKSCYNKAYDFYRPDVKKDVRNEFAYGVAFAYPDITHGIVDEVIQNFAQRIKLPLDDRPYTKSERDKWQTIQKLQNSYAWLADGTRKDAGYAFTHPKDGFEFEIDLESKPSSNEVKLTTNVPKNVVAYVQAEIPFIDQVKNRDQRKHDVTNSLAVYHAEKRDNVYETGKVAHIYRPMAWDSSGYRVFCEFKDIEKYQNGTVYDISNGLTIVIPQEFLDNAQYPITVDPTFGYTTQGGSTLDMSNKIVGTKQTMGSGSGFIGSVMYFYGSSPGTGSLIQSALFSTDNNFNLLKTTPSQASGSGQWFTGDIMPFPLLGSTDYILAVWGNQPTDSGQGAQNFIVYDSTVGKTSYNLTQTYVANSWPKDLTGSGTDTSRQYSIYVTYGRRYPIMVGSVTALSVTASRFLTPMVTNDTAWTSTNTAGDSIAPVVTDLRNLNVQITTTPASGSRTISTSQNHGTSVITTSMSSPSTSASDVTHVNSLAAGDTIEITTTGGDTTTVSPVRWSLEQVGTNQIWFSGSQGNLSTSANRFTPVQGTDLQSTSAATASQVAPESGTLQNLYVKMSGTLSSGSYLVEIYTGTVGSETASGVKVTLDSSNQSALDSTHTIAVTQGQGMYIQITPTTPSNARSIAIGIEYVSGTTGNAVLLSGNNVNASASATVYNNWYGTGAWNATETNVQALSAQIVLTSMYVRLSAAPGAVGKTRTITFRKGAADTAASVAITNAGTSGTWSGSLAIGANNLINVAQTPASTPAASTVKYGIVYNYGSDQTTGNFLVMFYP